MLCEDRFQLTDFFAQPLTLRKCAFQSGSKIARILHESTFCNNGTGQDSGLITANPSSRQPHKVSHPLRQNDPPAFDSAIPVPLPVEEHQGHEGVSSMRNAQRESRP